MSDDIRRNQLAQLVFYAIDKASPYDLAQHPDTNDLAKIIPYSLVALNVAPGGRVDMWLRINAYIGRLGGKPISPSTSINADTVKGVWEAACKAANLDP